MTNPLVNALILVFTLIIAYIMLRAIAWLLRKVWYYIEDRCKQEGCTVPGLFNPKDNETQIQHYCYMCTGQVAKPLCKTRKAIRRELWKLMTLLKENIDNFTFTN
jgi:hypothetical protein